MQNILKKPEQHPEKVIILSSNMGDHIPEFDKEKWEKRTLEDERNFSHTKEAEDYVTNNLKEWIIECGINPEKIEIIQGNIREMTDEEKEEGWEKKLKNEFGS